MLITIIITLLVCAIAIPFYNGIWYVLVKKKLPYELERSVINGHNFVEIKFKEHTNISLSGNVDFVVNGDVFFVNNGKLCLLSRDDVHIDGKNLYMQCRNNPLLERYKTIKDLIEKHDADVLELELQKES